MSLSREVHALGEGVEFNGTPLNSGLLYVIEGLVPLLSTFCEQMRSHSSAGLSSKVFSELLTPQAKECLITIGCNLSVRHIQYTCSNNIHVAC